MTTPSKNICILCNKNTPGSEEDAIPRWVRRLQATVAGSPYETLVDGVVVRRTDYVPRSVTRRPCKDCNGWMNTTFENPAKQCVRPLILGHCAVMEPHEQALVGRWVTKTLLMQRINRATKTGAEYAPPFPDEEYHYLRQHGEPSSRIRVWIGGFRPLNTATLATEPLTPTPGRDHLFNGKVQPSTIQIKHLVAQLVYAVAGEIGAFENTAETLGLLGRVWPPHDERIVWPPRYVMDRDIFRAVCDMLPLS